MLTKNNAVDEQRTQLIAQALETDEGRVALAQAMVEPIRRALEYQAVGRKLLMVDELPQGALPRYERDVRSVAHVISRRGGVPHEIQEGEEILVPLFEEDGRCWGVLDLDSYEVDAFGREDVAGLLEVLRAAGLAATEGSTSDPLLL